MGQSFFLLTAAMLAGQGVEQVVPVQYTPAAGCASCQARAAAMNPTMIAPESPTFMDRVRAWKPFNRSSAGSDQPRWIERMQTRMSGLFHSNSGPADDGAIYNSDSNVIMPSGQPYQRMPSTKMSEPPLAEPETKPAVNLTISPISFHAAPARKELSSALADKVGHDSDYSWITGQIRLEGGRWVLRYAGQETIDRYGGRLFLAPAGNMANFHDGDLVTVEGHVVGSGGSNGAIYQANAVNLVQHEAHD